MAESFSIFLAKLWIYPTLSRRAAGLEWAIAQGLTAGGTRAAQMKFGQFVAEGMPFITDEAAIAMTCYTWWACVWDDHLDTLVDKPGEAVLLSAEANRAFYELFAAPVPDDPLLTSLREVAVLMQSCIGPEALATVRGENANWLWGALWKLGLRSRSTSPTISEYLRMRWPKCGGGALAVYTAPGAGYSMAPSEHYDPLVRAFTQSVFLPCTIINDLGSLGKSQRTTPTVKSAVSPRFETTTASTTAPHC